MRRRILIGAVAVMLVAIIVLVFVRPPTPPPMTGVTTQADYSHLP